MLEDGILKWLSACSKSTWQGRDFRSSKQHLILVQIWVVLILSHLVYALRERIGLAADCDPFEVSVPRYGSIVASARQVLSTPTRTARSIGSRIWPGACASTSRAQCAPSEGFLLPTSTSRSPQTTAGACSFGSEEACT
jgi:hypothetical protein